MPISFKSLCARYGLRTGDIDVATLEGAHRQEHKLGIAKTHRTGVQIATAGIRAEQAIHQGLIAPQRLERVPHRALDAGTGQAGVTCVALALDGIVDDADGLPRPHVHGAYGIEK